MNTATQTMTGANSLAQAAEIAIDLSRKYDQSFLAKLSPANSHVAYDYVIFTHKPFLHEGDELLGHYQNGELIS